MSQPHTFEFDNDEFVVQDPASAQSWVEALSSFIEEFAERNYSTQWQSDREPLRDETLGKIAALVPLAIKEFRGYTDEQRAETTFKSVLQWKLVEEFESDSINDCQIDAMYGADVQQYYDELITAIEGVDGPVADEEEVWEGIKDKIVEKMWEHDDSDIFDWLQNPSIPFSFSPMRNPAPVSGGTMSVDDLMIYTDKFGHGGPSIEIDAMAQLLRLDLRSLMPLLQVDYKDDEKIRSWMTHSIKIESDLPSVVSKEQFHELMDNCSSSYVYPEWVGCLELREICSLDPCKPLKLTGGMIAFMDFVNGAGHAIEMSSDTFLIVHPDQSLAEEPGRYTLNEITGDRPDASVHNCDVQELKAKHRESLIPQKSHREELSFG